MAEEIVNRVAKSPLISLDLSEYYQAGERVVFDLAPHLFQGLVLREKDFRQMVKETDWSEYAGKCVAITCSVDAIVPTWAYMLLTAVMEPHARIVVFGSLETLETVLFHEALDTINVEDFRDAMVVVKGCSDVPVPESAYVELSRRLRPVVKSLMFGEPCSTVPIYKKKRERA
ncbi:hypothetical protein FUAX_31430 [Fulvitalea axinellae]|uniref:DUF2480 family protein n=1 Tax=Fulvitalea axinellae TaxID=1182444 RepID=A0AAU9CNL2_9BACT|nr:hypothetical protein FUAX_31430 [Fulvitalea axinellae]